MFRKISDNNNKSFSSNRKCITLLITFILLVFIFIGCSNQTKITADDLKLGIERQENGSKKEKQVSFKEDGVKLIGNWYMDTRLSYVLSSVWHRMGDINEIFNTASRIRHTSELSWFREWTKTAEWVESTGDESLAKGHKISAGDAYLRASRYYLAAEVFLHTNPEDPRIPETYKKAGDLFIKALKLLSVSVELVHIPYEDTTIRAYFFKSVNAKEKAPVIIAHQGFDAPIEATKYIAEEANKRGYHCLLFEGPGQGLTIREQNIPFRYDWENAVTPVVDYIIKRSEVDKNNIIAMGISLGGGLITRAAAFENRVKVYIANPGYINFYDVFKDILTEKLTNLYEEDPEEFDKKALDMIKYDVGIRWGFNHAFWVFGAKKPSELFDILKKFDNSKIIKNIKSQMIVMDGTSELWGKGQAKQLYDMLDSPKKYMLFTEEDYASAHCQVGGEARSVQKLFDWLDEYLNLQ